MKKNKRHEAIREIQFKQIDSKNKGQIAFNRHRKKAEYI